MAAGILPRLLSALVLLAAPAAASADERILDFSSGIVVHADASMTVTETITVRSEGDAIRRGIFRDFPTDYTDRLGNRYVVAFEVLAVTRDGVREAWHSERLSNGTRVYIGRRDRFRLFEVGHDALVKDTQAFRQFDELFLPDIALNATRFHHNGQV